MVLFFNPCFFQPYPSSKRLYPRSRFRGSSWMWISINDEIVGSSIWGVSKNGTPKSYGFSSFAFLKLPFWGDILPRFTRTQELSWPIQVLADLPSQFSATQRINGHATGTDWLEVLIPYLCTAYVIVRPKFPGIPRTYGLKNATATVTQTFRVRKFTLTVYQHL